MDIVIVRHGESECNAEGRLQGWLDSPLSERGRAQAALLGAWLGRIGFVWHRAYASPLSRAYETAQIAARACHGDAPAQEPLLKEIGVGSIEGLTGEEIRARHPGYGPRPLSQLGDFSEFGGESYDDVQLRVERMIQQLEQLHRQNQEHVLLVAHGGFNLQLVKRLISDSNPRACFFEYGNCTATRVRMRLRRGVYIGEVSWHVPLELMGGG